MYFRKYAHALLLLAGCMLLLAGYVAAQPSYARKENNIWLGGYVPPFMSTSAGASGINFNTGAPETVWCSGLGMTSWLVSRGSASICDAMGNLLFYTDGTVVWDRNHHVMANGWDINNNDNMAFGTSYIHPIFDISAPNVDGVVILPMPGSSHKYYIFSIPWIYDTNIYGHNPIPSWQGKLFATIVDMEANNGLGAVDTGYRGVLINDAMNNNLQGVVGDNCDYWLLGYGSEGDGRYKAFHITAEQGINAEPVVSILPVPLSYAYFAGWGVTFELNISPDRRKTAMAVAGSEVQVADFDPATGQLSNSFLIGAQDCKFVTFSPNSQVLYLSGLIAIRQYNLADLSTPFTLLWFNNYTDFEYNAPMRLGPDGKIYLSFCGGLDGVYYTLHNCLPASIQDPDIFGTGCQMEFLQGPPLYMLKDFAASLPNEIPVLVYDTASEVKEVPLCFHQPAVVTPGVSGTDYHWMVNTTGTTFPRVGDDATDTLMATEPGIYAVQYFTTDPCTFHRDTFIVKEVNYSLYLGPDQVSCDGSPVGLSANELAGASYQWSDGSDGRELEVAASGLYWVDMAYGGCTARDSILVEVPDMDPGLPEDTLVCAEDPYLIPLHAAAPAGAAIQWNTGSTEANLQVGQPGLYTVAVRYKECYGADSILVEAQYCDCPFMMPTAFSPNDDGTNDRYGPALPGNCPAGSFRLDIYNRWGQRVFAGFRLEDQWDGMVNGQPADVGTYMYHLQMTVGLRKKEVTKKGDFVLIR